MDSKSAATDLTDQPTNATIPPDGITDLRSDPLTSTRGQNAPVPSQNDRTSGLQTPVGNYAFADEFNGKPGDKPGAPWQFFDAWGSGNWRDAVYDDKHAKIDGNGNLVISGAMENGQFKTSYLQTYDWLNPDAPSVRKFGPGKYLEARIDMSQMQCESCWGSFWLFDPTDAYDSDPTNGTEIDIASSAGQTNGLQTSTASTRT
jgi:hypothetical protein